MRFFWGLLDKFWRFYLLLDDASHLYKVSVVQNELWSVFLSWKHPLITVGESAVQNIITITNLDWLRLRAVTSIVKLGFWSWPINNLPSLFLSISLSLDDSLVLHMVNFRLWYAHMHRYSCWFLMTLDNWWWLMTIEDNWWQLMTIDDNFDVWNGSLHVMVMDRLTHGWTKLFFKYCKWKCRMSLQNWNIYLSFDRFWINRSVLMLIKSWELEQIFVSFK